MSGLVEFGIRCPRCRQGLLERSEQGDARCGACGACYPIEAGVVCLLAPSREARTLAQAAMEWPLLIRIYESRLWRRNPLFAMVTGISFDQEYALINKALGLGEGDRLLDLACGPGIYARRFARVVSQGVVVGLDLSAPMLRYAQQKATAQGLRNLLFVRGDAMALAFEEECFDAVNCCGALHLFPSATQALSEIARVLRPKGRFSAAVFRRSEGEQAAQGTARQRAVSGVDAYSITQIGALFEEAGLCDVTFLHKGARWLVVSAEKAG